MAARASRTTGFSRSVARAIVGNDNCCRQDCFRGAVILAKAGRLGLKQPPGGEGGEIEASNSLASSLRGSRAGDRRVLAGRSRPEVAAPVDPQHDRLAVDQRPVDIEPRTGSAIAGNRSVKSAPRRLQTFARSPSLRARMRLSQNGG